MNAYFKNTKATHGHILKLIYFVIICNANVTELVKTSAQPNLAAPAHLRTRKFDYRPQIGKHSNTEGTLLFNKNKVLNVNIWYGITRTNRLRRFLDTIKK